MAGYSQKSLAAKLGIKEGNQIAIVNGPENYAATLGKLPPAVEFSKPLRGPLDFIQFFSTDRKDLEKEFPSLKSALAQNGSLWISWPKTSSHVKTDLNENVVRAVGLRNGLVDIKVCAVDETWSGLKFVFRLKDRRS